MIVLGFDPGKAVGFAQLEWERPALPRFVRGASLDREAALAEVRALGASESKADALVVVERFAAVYNKRGFTPRMANDLLACDRLADELLDLSRALGLEVMTFDATTWRKRCVGKRTAKDRDVRTWARLCVPGVRDTHTNEHVRDAIGVAWCGVLERRVVSVGKPLRSPLEAPSEPARRPL